MVKLRAFLRYLLPALLFANLFNTMLFGAIVGCALWEAGLWP